MKDEEFGSVAAVPGTPAPLTTMPTGRSNPRAETSLTLSPRPGFRLGFFLRPWCYHALGKNASPFGWLAMLAEVW